MNKSHLTAIRRNKLSFPMAELQKRGLLKGRILDYGCGRGDDAEALNLDKFDPHYFPDTPKGVYSTITCIYVLNVIPALEANEVIGRMIKLLSPNGKMYIAVRRDLKTSRTSKRGTLQRIIKLDLPIISKPLTFCIYMWENRE